MSNLCVRCCTLYVLVNQLTPKDIPLMLKKKIDSLWMAYTIAQTSEVPETRNYACFPFRLFAFVCCCLSAWLLLMHKCLYAASACPPHITSFPSLTRSGKETGGKHYL